MNCFVFFTDPGGRLMGKRSNFERRKADFYATPRAAVAPLIPHLRGIQTFAEPCVGDGDLVRHLETLGLRCVYAGDIRTGQDALARNSYGAADAIITNPPYTRDLMHRLIAHFQRIARTWLLIDYDWAATKQAAPYTPNCSVFFFCSPACKQSAWRKRLSVTPSVTPAPAPNAPMNHRTPRKCFASPTCRCFPEVRGGRLGAVACSGWHAPR